MNRMLAALNKERDAFAETLDRNVRSAVAEFVQGAPQFDDMTTLCFRYKGEKDVEETKAEDLFF